jgi:hypothetical protein
LLFAELRVDDLVLALWCVIFLVGRKSFFPHDLPDFYFFRNESASRREGGGGDFWTDGLFPLLFQKIQFFHYKNSTSSSERFRAHFGTELDELIRDWMNIRAEADKPNGRTADADSGTFSGSEETEESGGQSKRGGMDNNSRLANAEGKWVRNGGK